MTLTLAEPTLYTHTYKSSYPLVDRPKFLFVGQTKPPSEVTDVVADANKVIEVPTSHVGVPENRGQLKPPISRDVRDESSDRRFFEVFLVSIDEYRVANALTDDLP